jgi:hypothetical protein
MTALLLCVLVAPASAALTGQQIMEKNDQLPQETTSIQNNVLAVIRAGNQELKNFETRYQREGGKIRMKIAFTSPTRLEFLVWDEPNADSQQWMKMSSGRVRKIATADQGSAWVNSDFYNEDLNQFDIEEYSFNLLGESSIQGVDCYRVEAVKNSVDARVYTKRIFHVGKQDYVIRKIEFYEDGQNRKNLLLENIEQIEGIYTARKAVMERSDGSSKSILYLKDVKHNVPVSDRDLTRESF